MEASYNAPGAGAPPQDGGGGSSSSSAERPKRKSEPVRAGLPETRLQESWEYPLSREEKKHRVMCLFEQELAEARRSGEELVLEELYSQLERIEELQPGTARRLKDAVRGLTGGEPPEDDSPVVIRRRQWPVPLGLALGAVALAIAVGWWMQAAGAGAGSADQDIMNGTGLPAMPPVAIDIAGAGEMFPGHSDVEALLGSAEGSLETPKPAMEHDSSGGHVLPTTSTTSELLSSSRDRVLRFFQLGQSNLRKSDCYQAQYYFGQALKLFQQVEVDHPSQHEGVMFELWVNYAFSLVCAQRFQEGADMLEGCVTGALDCASHLLNARGFALFHLKDYAGAAQAFQLGAEKDQRNPIIWNNLGAAHMVLRNYEAADEALLHVAGENEKGGLKLSPHHWQVISTNVQELQHRAETGQVSRLPLVELWFGDDDEDREGRVDHGNEMAAPGLTA